jgi:hypothetical protein
MPEDLPYSSIKDLSKDPNQELEELICLHESLDKEFFKRSHSDIMMEEEFFTSNSSSSDIKNHDHTHTNVKAAYKK